MTWRSHIMVGLLLVASIIAVTDIQLSLAILVATIIGSLAPDLDASDAKIKHLRYAGA